MSVSSLTDKTDVLEILSSNAASFALPEGFLFDPQKEADRCRDLGIQVLTLGGPEYPQLLAAIPDPPKVLYVRGRLPTVGALALVGSRRPSSYGLRAAKRLSADAAGSGIVTVSGMARGIDTEVHRSTMEARGITWAVLGSGLDRIYPPENADLAERIVAQGGALVSEVPLSGPPLAANFPRRNRIISGLAWGTVVVEGGGKSGALITARCSAEQGREVLAVPGPVDSPMSEGPLGLIRDGAVMVRQWNDVLEALPLLAMEAHDRFENKGVLNSDETVLDPEERRIMELIGAEETQLEELLTVSGLGMDRLAAALLSLEMKERIRSCPGQRYAKR